MTIQTKIAMACAVGAFLSGCGNAAKDQVSEGLMLAADYKVGVAEYYVNTGSFPEDADRLGIGTSKNSRFVEDILVDNGTITIVYGNEAEEELSGEMLSFKPYVDNNSDIVWVCGYALYEGPVNPQYPGSGANETTVAQDLLPKNCQGPGGWKSAEVESDEPPDVDVEIPEPEPSISTPPVVAQVSQSNAADRWMTFCTTTQNSGFPPDKHSAYCGCVDNGIRGVLGPNIFGPVSEAQYSAFVDLVEEIYRTRDIPGRGEELTAPLLLSDGSLNLLHPAGPAFGAFGGWKELCRTMVN